MLSSFSFPSSSRPQILGIPHPLLLLLPPPPSYILIASGGERSTWHTPRIANTHRLLFTSARCRRPSAPRNARRTNERATDPIPQVIRLFIHSLVRSLSKPRRSTAPTDKTPTTNHPPLAAHSNPHSSMSLVQFTQQQTQRSTRSEQANERTSACWWCGDDDDGDSDYFAKRRASRFASIDIPSIWCYCCCRHNDDSLLLLLLLVRPSHLPHS